MMLAERDDDLTPVKTRLARKAMDKHQRGAGSSVVVNNLLAEDEGRPMRRQQAFRREIGFSAEADRKNGRHDEQDETKKTAQLHGRLQVQNFAIALCEYYIRHVGRDGPQTHRMHPFLSRDEG